MELFKSSPVNVPALLNSQAPCVPADACHITSVLPSPLKSPVATAMNPCVLPRVVVLNEPSVLASHSAVIPPALRHKISDRPFPAKSPDVTKDILVETVLVSIA